VCNGARLALQIPPDLVSFNFSSVKRDDGTGLAGAGAGFDLCCNLLGLRFRDVLLQTPLFEVMFVLVVTRMWTFVSDNFFTCVLQVSTHTASKLWRAFISRTISRSFFLSTT
jgi:hypothetical protein